MFKGMSSRPGSASSPRGSVGVGGGVGVGVGGGVGGGVGSGSGVGVGVGGGVTTGGFDPPPPPPPQAVRVIIADKARAGAARRVSLFMRFTRIPPFRQPSMETGAISPFQAGPDRAVATLLTDYG